MTLYYFFHKIQDFNSTMTDNGDAAAGPTADTTEEVAMLAPASTAEDQATSKPADGPESTVAAATEATKPEEAAKPEETTQSSPTPPARTSTREKRVRKSVDSYDPSSSLLATKAEVIIPDGSGEKLAYMPRVTANFKDITRSDPHLKMLHTIVFGRGQKKEFKSHLLQFNGLVHPSGKEEEEREKLLLKMYKLVLGDLKEVMDLCDIDRSAESFGTKGGTPDKDMLCNRFLEWLEKPKSSGKEVKKAPAKKAAKKSAPAAAKADSNSAKKRGRPKGSTGSAKKAKAATAKAEVVESKDDVIDFSIPGVELEKVNEKIKDIVASADRETLTVRGVRKILEEWLDTDLEPYKDVIRSLVMQAM